MNKYIERLVAEVNQYYNVFGEPIPMQILSAKYSRAIPDFPEVIQQLINAKELEVVLLKTGKRLVYPYGELTRVPDNGAQIGAKQ